MKPALLLLLVVFLCGGGAQAACPTPPACTGNSLNIVTDCGAICDGDQPNPHDATAAINCALDAVGTAGGGLVTIPPGTCTISPNTNTQTDPNAFLHLYSNMTIRGAGRKSILKIKNGIGDYPYIFSNAVGLTSLNNLVIKDFAIDQNVPDSTSTANINPKDRMNCNCTQYAIAPTVSTTAITVSGMFFDPTDSTNTINLTTNPSNVTLAATITNNYFRFVKGPSSQLGGWYDVSTVIAEGSQQVITNNTFTTTLADLANVAIETLGGRNVIANNTVVNYMTAVDVLPSYYACPACTLPPCPACPDQLNPTETVVANNSVTCALVGMIIWPTTGVILRNASVTGNTINVCNATRGTQYAIPGSTDYSGIETTYFINPGNKRGYAGDVDGLIISYNVITFEKENRAYSPDNGQYTGAIRLWQLGNLSNVLVKGNVIKDAPAGGIRVGAAGVPHSTVQRLRIVDNVIVDAGNNSPLAQTYRHAIGLFDEVHDADVSRNMISDTQSGSAPWGYYSLYLQQTAASVNVRTSQNTVRVNSTASPGLRSFQGAAGLMDAAKDASNANDLLISTITGGPGASLNVDFLSFTQYLTTINTSDGALTVSPPTADANGAQWIVGQLINFRFLCAVAAGCVVSFDPRYSTSGNLTIPNGRGRAITFQVENWFADSVPRNFFELYRSPTAILNQ